MTTRFALTDGTGPDGPEWKIELSYETLRDVYLNAEDWLEDPDNDNDDDRDEAWAMVSAFYAAYDREHITTTHSFPSAVVRTAVADWIWAAVEKTEVNEILRDGRFGATVESDVDDGIIVEFLKSLVNAEDE